jgi:hypothetical protein
MELAGTSWKLIEARAFDETGRELRPPLGPQPMGILTFGVERMMVAVCDSRTALPAGAPAPVLFYAGIYRFDGTVLVTRVDAASRPDMLDTEQIRSINFEGTRMVAIPLNPVLDRNSGLRLVWDRIG